MATVKKQSEEKEVGVDDLFQEKTTKERMQQFWSILIRGLGLITLLIMVVGTAWAVFLVTDTQFEYSVENEVQKHFPTISFPHQAAPEPETVEGGPYFFSTSKECEGVTYAITVETDAAVVETCEFGFGTFRTNRNDGLHSFGIAWKNDEVVALENDTWLPCKQITETFWECEGEGVTMTAEKIDPVTTDKVELTIDPYSFPTCSNTEIAEDVTWVTAGNPINLENGINLSVMEYSAGYTTVTVASGTNDLEFVIDHYGQSVRINHPQHNFAADQFNDHTLAIHLSNGYVIYVYFAWADNGVPNTDRYSLYPEGTLPPACSAN